MTSNPGDEKVIQDDIRFKGEVTSKDHFAGKLASKSFPIWRVYQDGSETVAIDDSETEIERSEDAATVWQSAADAAHNAYDSSTKEIPRAIIDGGGLTYQIDSSLDVNDGPVIRNVEFDMSNAGSSDQITIGGPDDGFTNGGVWLQNAVVTAPPNPIRFRDLIYCELGPIRVRDAVGDGVDFQSCIGCNIKINVKGAGGDGIRFTDGGSTGFTGNSNRVMARANSADQTGIVNLTLRNTVFLKAIGEASGTHGINDAGQGCIWINPTTEENTNHGILTTASKSHYIAPHSNNDSGASLRFGGSSSRCRLRGPVRSDNTVTISATAADNIIENVDPSNLALGTERGVRTVENGLGENGSNDPSVGGDWNGNGYEGVTVHWDDGAGNNFASKYMNGGWRQIASW